MAPKRKKVAKRSRTGPKNKAGNCKFGVVKSGPRAGNCLKGPRPKKR